MPTSRSRNLRQTHDMACDNLAGKQTIGVYPLLTDDSCYFLAAVILWM
jgi:hypothetical protein